MKAMEKDEPFDQQQYQSAVGSLLYLSVATRTDITLAVSSVSKLSANPTTRHCMDCSQVDNAIFKRNNRTGPCVRTTE